MSHLVQPPLPNAVRLGELALPACHLTQLWWQSDELDRVDRL